jgi:hypothetical protein
LIFGLTRQLIAVLFVSPVDPFDPLLHSALSLFLSLLGSFLIFLQATWLLLLLYSIDRLFASISLNLPPPGSF